MINANKTEIKKAVEQIFDVKVEKVNTIRQQGKLRRMGVHIGRRPSYKKAIVKLTLTVKKYRSLKEWHNREEEDGN